MLGWWISTRQGASDEDWVFWITATSESSPKHVRVQKNNISFTTTCVQYCPIKDRGRHSTSKHQHNLCHDRLLRRARTESIFHLRKSSNNKQVDSFHPEKTAATHIQLPKAEIASIENICFHRESLFSTAYERKVAYPAIVPIYRHSTFMKRKRTPTDTRPQPDLFFKCFSFPRENRFLRLPPSSSSDTSLGSSPISHHIALPSTTTKPEDVLQKFEVVNATVMTWV